MDASEDSVWHYEPLLWQNGGSILNEDDTQAAFNSPEGVEALDVLAGMAVEDKSVFLDLQNSPYTGLFNSGKIGMLETGPWDLASFPDVDYGVEILPGFNGDHQTIAGPDMWTVFDNGGGRAQAAQEFLQWLTAPEQIQTGGPRDRSPSDPPVGRAGPRLHRSVREDASRGSTCSRRTSRTSSRRGR